MTVALCAALAAGLVVGVTLFEMRGQTTTIPGAVTTPQPGVPRIQLEFGLRDDAEVRALGRAELLLDGEHQQPAAAAAIFRRYHSFDAQLGLLFASWRGPSSLPAVRQLVSRHPDDPASLLNLGFAEYWAGRNADAVASWQKLAREYPDSPYGVDAEDALYTAGPPGLPFLQLDFQPSAAIARLPAAQQLAALARAAARPDPRAKLLYGAFLWNRLRRPLSAERQFRAAASLAPNDPVARTAAAVGLFTKADPVQAFAHLGPLTGVFPESPVVRFELGMLLLWRDELQKAATQLRLAVADGPHTIYAGAAKQLLSRIPAR